MLYNYPVGWADEADKKIISDAKWQAVLVGGNPEKNKFSFYYTRIRHRLFIWLSKQHILKYNIAEQTEARCFKEKLRRAKKIKAAWYIGHNLGSLPIAVKAAAHNKARSGFDFEDYHRHEYDIGNTRRTERIIFLENKYIPKVDYLSFSSGPIREQILKNFPGFQKPHVVLRNCFTINELSAKIKEPGKVLKLLWFSQTVGPNRGLECLFEALQLLKDKDICLTLAGRIRNDVLESFPSAAQKIAGTVTFAGVIEPHELHTLAEQHDVGLA